ncbi:serpin family protein, partial [Candidatus Pacearchaeota archaeon CG_4_10_14_0_2_um_filter_05_32_18]
FNAENTADGQFKLGSGASTTAEMMYQINDFKYGETKDLQILEMDYLGNDLSMLIILPKENDLNSLENSISVSNLASWEKNMDTEEVRVTIPKFKFETKYFMAEDLKEMGMPTAFDGSLADFTGMWNRQRDENLYISQVIHQTFIEVAEAGTEAAAATAVIVGETSAGPGPVTKPKVFTANHPFIFIIQQKDTGNILFMGRVSNPTTQ